MVSLGLAYGVLGVYSGLVKGLFRFRSNIIQCLRLFKVYWCLCRVGLGIILISFKTLWLKVSFGDLLRVGRLFI